MSFKTRTPAQPVHKDDGNDFLTACMWIGGGALALAAIGGIGVVGSFGAIGLAAEEMAVLGAVGGAVAHSKTKSKKTAPEETVSEEQEVPVRDTSYNFTRDELNSMRRGEF